MSELGRVLRLDARRTALLAAVPLLAGIGVVTAWLALMPGVAHWDESIAALVNAVRTLGPVAAGLSAWAAVRDRRLDCLRDLTARSPATGVLLDLLLLSIAALAAYAAVTFVITVATLLRQEAGHAHPLGLLAGAAALVLHVVAGYLTGRIVPHRATPAAVAVLTALWAFMRAPGASWLSLLPPAALEHVELFTGLRPRVQADQALIAAGLCAALVLMYVSWVTRRAALAVPLALAIAVTAVATIRLQLSDGRMVSADQINPVCSEWPLTICVHPALREALPALMMATTPLAARLHGTPGRITRVEQRPSSEPASVTNGVAVIHLGDDLTAGYALRAVQQIRDGLVSSGACAGPRPPGAAGYRALVDAWLLDEGTPGISDVRAADRFGSWSEQRRRAWLRTHFTDYRNCALSPRDFRPVAAKSSIAAQTSRPPRTAPRTPKRRSVTPRRAKPSTAAPRTATPRTAVPRTPVPERSTPLRRHGSA